MPSKILKAVFRGRREELSALLASAPALTIFETGAAVDALIAAGADVHAWSANAIRNQPLHEAMAGRGDLRILTALLARGVDVNTAEAGGLHAAALDRRTRRPGAGQRTARPRGARGNAHREGPIGGRHRARAWPRDRRSPAEGRIAVTGEFL